MRFCLLLNVLVKLLYRKYCNNDIISNFFNETVSRYFLSLLFFFYKTIPTRPLIHVLNIFEFFLLIHRDVNKNVWSAKCWTNRLKVGAMPYDLKGHSIKKSLKGKFPYKNTYQ
jgi:hypothetical protein